MGQEIQYVKFQGCGWWYLIICSSERQPRVGISFVFLPFFISFLRDA